MKKSVIVGALLIGLLGWLHKALLLVAFILLACLFIVRRKHRVMIVAGTLLAIGLVIPAIVYLNGNGVTQEAAIQIRPGFLYQSTTWHELPSIVNPWHKWLIYWWLNFGLLPFTGTLGWLWLASSKKMSEEKIDASHSFLMKKILQTETKLIELLHAIRNFVLRHFVRKKILISGLRRMYNYFKKVIFQDSTAWYVSAVALFIISNIFTFSNDIATNHKLLNYSQIIWGVFSAILLAKLWRTRIKILIVPLFFMLILGGVFDLFPILNQGYYEWPDAQSDPRSEWIMSHTDRDAVFFNTSYDTNYITVTGRKIFWGWPYFTWSIGYPTDQRQQEMQKLLLGFSSKDEFCDYLAKNNLDYVVAQTGKQDDFIDIQVNTVMLEDFFGDQKVEFPESVIYLARKSCLN